MIRSMPPAELPIAGKNSEPQHYEQKVQKQKDLPKTWVLTGKQFEDFRRKKTETLFSTSQKTQCNTRPLNRIFEYGPCN